MNSRIPATAFILRLRKSYLTVFCCAFACLLGTVASAESSLQTRAHEGQKRVVKIYGAGGVASMEGYQSGFLVSPEGHIATAWSSVLDVDPIVILDDGRRFESKIVGFEPTLELAVLKIDAGDLPFFEVRAGDMPTAGTPVLAISNLFGIATGDEPASVMRGVVSTVAPLAARRGTFKSSYSGEVLLLDLIANNPGAAGGALIDTKGNLIGMLGKELRDESTGVWLNYALPSSALRGAIAAILSGKQQSMAANAAPVLPRNEAHSVRGLGIILIPDVLEKTPAYVDDVRADSPAAAMKVQADDLILLINNQRIESQRDLVARLRRIDRRDPVQLVLQRGTEIIPLTLKP
ncbi:Putative serine protease HtrA [Roseimaritima multifibrata]|uniref:Serine protease HtrA n=1 Tax=Roseimaritima multifibrata TaxID=1930274 RepID=A0A517MKA2_9BACT|nr:S1C family serine protease [Roseimaritima multifibrata]QDS95316.1 Putative serine protease HtrA [Roseimaritima multifibrata]